jgi:hypothetical protein
MWIIDNHGELSSHSSQPPLLERQVIDEGIRGHIELPLNLEPHPDTHADHQRVDLE